MTRASLLAVAARVEAAEGADYQLDRAITDALDWPNGMGTPPDLYTASLDAAASLLKPHHRVHVVQHETYTAVKVWDARVAMFVGSSSASGEHAEPRARTAAALRAMAEEAPHE